MHNIKSSSAEKLAKSDSLECLMDRPSKGPKWEQNNTMGVPGHFITAGNKTMGVLRHFMN